MKKRAVTLIEVTICLALITLLLSTLLFWHRHLIENKEALDKQKKPFLELRYAWQRLESILPTAQAPFFRDQGLVFRFDRGLYHEPKLSEMVLGKLHYDESERRLLLTIWPDPLEEHLTTPSQTVTLLEDISEVSYDFYSPPNPFKLTVDPDHVGHPQPREGWQDTWLASYTCTPALVKMTFEQSGKERQLIFDLNHPILYSAEGGA